MRGHTRLFGTLVQVVALGSLCAWMTMGYAADDPTGSTASEDHEKLFAEDRFPSAAVCGTCHPKQYEEWSISQHSYSQLSPVYLSLSNKINVLANGSNGDFCFRCHSPVGANLGESPAMSNLDRHPTSREGITCVVCHRIGKSYNKASGRLALEEGDLLTPVYGPQGNAEMARVLKRPGTYSVVAEANKIGRKVHAEVKKSTSLSSPVFCGSCHDVTLFNGFRLEEAFSEYRTSPAAARGVTCQDCHMGKIQGIESGYEVGPAAVIGGVPTKPRKLASHVFAGPDYSVLHPGIFPHNSDAQEFATLREWLQFDYKAGWGTEAFEDALSEDESDRIGFPERWEIADDRLDARDLITEQLARLDWMRQKRLEVLRNGYGLGDIVTEAASVDGIHFKVQVKNLTDGHNAPTGFTGERVVWLGISVKDRDGTEVFKSGDRDPNGDLRDSHSSYVHGGKLALDPYLFSLQSTFVVQNVRGGESEQVIPIPYPSTSLPRVLPSPASLVFAGEPPTERNHKKSIEPLGQRWAHFEVEADALTGKGPYTATVRLLAQMVPINLILGIQDVGFDYGMSPKAVGDAVIAGHEVLWEKTIDFKTK